MAGIEARAGLDKYLRRDNTLLARTIQRISPSTGVDYRMSPIKGMTERTIATAMIFPSMPLISILGVLATLDGGPPFYRDIRVDQNGNQFSITKIRSMKVGSEPDQGTALLAAQFEAEEDPRSTRLGEFMRAIDIDELPQIFQVVFGKLSLIGIRAVAPYAQGFIQGNVSNDKFKKWEKAYRQGKPGLFNLNAAMSRNRKDDLKRLWFDLFYAQHASLGFDLYILYRVGRRIAKKLAKRIINYTEKGRQNFHQNLPVFTDDARNQYISSKKA